MKDILDEIEDVFNKGIKSADKATIGQKLQEKRHSLHLTIGSISKISGLSEFFIKQIENDKINDIKISTMKKLSMAYDLSPDVFVKYMG